MKIKGGKFLITGGASMIGAHITEQLLAADAREVVLLDNFSLGSPEGISDLVQNPRVKLVRGDILRVNELFDGLEAVDGVFAAAGFLTLPLTQNPHLGVAVNVQGMMNVFEASRYRGVGKVIFSSSSPPMASRPPTSSMRLPPGHGAICSREPHFTQPPRSWEKTSANSITIATA